MGYEKGVGEENEQQLENFQFPLWDTLLSQRQLKNHLMTFNSLYGIRWQSLQQLQRIP